MSGRVGRIRARRPDRRKSRNGAALVEFALILPLLLMIVLGCIDFGRFAYYYVAVTNAATAGAHFGAFHPFTATTQATWVAKVKEAAQQEFPGVEVPDPVVVIDEQGGIKFRRITVQVNYTFVTVVPWSFGPLSIPSSTVLTRSVVERVVR